MFCIQQDFKTDHVQEFLRGPLCPHFPIKLYYWTFLSLFSLMDSNVTPVLVMSAISEGTLVMEINTTLLVAASTSSKALAR